VEFLHSLDLFVYDLGPRFASRGPRGGGSDADGRRAAGERRSAASLARTGSARRRGFLCTTPEEWHECAQRLRQDDLLRRKMSRAARSLRRTNCAARESFRSVQEALAA